MNIENECLEHAIKKNRFFQGENIHMSNSNKSGLLDISNRKLFDYDGFVNHLIAEEFNILYEPSRIPNWYNIGCEAYYFKDKGLFNELFLSELAHEFNLKSLDYQIVINEGKVGIISKNFRKLGHEYYRYHELFRHKKSMIPGNMEDYESLVNYYFPKVSAKNLIDSAYRLIVFDFFANQKDRAHYNVLFEKGNCYDLSNVYDNEMGLRYDYPQKYDSIFDNLIFPMKDEISDSETEVFRLLDGNNIFNKLLEHCLDIDIDSILERTIRKYQIVVYKWEKKEINDMFSLKKRIIENTLELKRTL